MTVPSVPSIFPYSRAVGDGMNPDTEERIRAEASASKLLKFGSGKTTLGVDHELDYFNIAQGDMNIDDDFQVIVITANSSNNSPSIRITDNSGYATSNLGTGINSKCINVFEIYTIMSNPGRADLKGAGYKLIGTSLSAFDGDWALTEEDVITKKLRISLRGLTTGTLYWKWWVYKRGQLF